MLHACQLLFGCRNTFFVGCEGSFCAVSWLKDFSEVKFVDFPAALGSYRFALTDIWYRCTARGPFKTHTIFFRESSSWTIFNSRGSIEFWGLKHIDFSGMKFIISWGLRPILWLSEFKKICGCGQMTCVFEDQTCSGVLMHVRNNYVY